MRPGWDLCWSGCGTILLSARRAAADGPPPLRVLWITPLRALAADTEAALRAPVEDLGLPWTVESRTGDTAPGVRARQSRRLPTALVTTPESLSLLLTRGRRRALFEHLELVVVDEWHELMASKRGVQTELALARLRRWRPEPPHLGALRDAGQSRRPRATLCSASLRTGLAQPGRIIRGLVPKALEVDSLIPETMERFPWSGQIGLRLLPEVIRAIEEGKTSLVFTNTRATAETLVSGPARGAARLGRGHRAAPRLAGPGHPRVGGGRHPRRAAPLRGLHLDPRPRRGLHPGGPGAPGRKPQGRGPARFSAPAGAATSPAPSAG